jgi:hypothetical protein
MRRRGMMLSPLNNRKDASVQQQQAPAPTVRFDSGTSALKIPFELSNNLILLQAQVNNSQPSGLSSTRVQAHR